MAKIIFLGTSGSSAVTSKQLRSSGGIIIQIEDLQFHLDPGPGALNKAKEYSINPNHTSAVLASHNHINHCNDINAVIEAMTHSGLEHRGIILASKSIIQPTNGQPFVTKYHQGLVERIIPLEKNHKIAIDTVEIHTIPAQHTDDTAVGFKFFTPHFVLGYSGDTVLTEELLDELMGSDILILNVPYPGNKATGMNLDSEAALKIIERIKPRLAILTHFGMEMLKADPMVEAREIQRLTGIQTIAAYDGLVVAPGSWESIKSPVKGY